MKHKRAILRYMKARLITNIELKGCVHTFQLPFDLLNIMLGIASWFYFAKMFGADAPILQPYGGSFLSYIILGMAINSYLNHTMNTFREVILEAYGVRFLRWSLALMPTHFLFLAKIKPIAVLLGDLIFGFIIQTINLSLYLIVGALIFGLDMGSADLPAAIILMALGMMATASFGLIFASLYWLIKYWKAGVDPIQWVIALMSSLVSGVYFPPELLPGWLRNFSYILPNTYVLAGARLAILRGFPIQLLMVEYVYPLIIFCSLLPLSIMLLRFSLKVAMERSRR